MDGSKERILYFYVTVFLSITLAGGFLLDGTEAMRGFLTLQLRPARLLSDFFAVVGIGAALVNAALVGSLGLILVAITQVRLSGPTIAAVFTMVGFGLFGKTPFNIVPIIAGVAIAARIAGKTFSAYILIALFGTALGPIVSTMAAELLPGVMAIPAGILGGLVAGLLLPSTAIAMLRLHQGFSLYNIGLTSGFLGVFVAATMRAFAGPLPAAPSQWALEVPTVIVWAIPVLALSLVVLAFTLSRDTAILEFRRIQKLPGRLPSDFMDMVGPAGAILNMGLMAILAWAFVRVVGAPLNGPVLGGILTVVGFSSFGNHPRNSWSVAAGVLLAAFVFGVSPAAPGPILAILFVTTLAPLAGEFGWMIGLVAGFIHLTLVLQTGSWHAGLSLYNNGFAGGLTATLIVAVIEWCRSNRETPFGKETR